MVRNNLKYVSWKDYKAVTADLKKIYQAVTEDAALQALDEFGQKWDDKYPQISKSWLANWSNLNTFFAYSMDIRKAIYTTNAIESLNSVIRHATKKKNLPNWWFREKGGIFSNYGSKQKMDDAYSELESCHESL